jgi:hypothetical protein
MFSFFYDEIDYIIGRRMSRKNILKEIKNDCLVDWAGIQVSGVLTARSVETKCNSQRISCIEGGQRVHEEYPPG